MPDPYGRRVLTADEVLRWGHTLATRFRRGHADVPKWVAAIDQEYGRRRKALHYTARTPL